MNDESPLLKLSEDAMDSVLHYCDYLEIARLRKTCRSLRDFVDIVKPDARMDKVEINCDANKVIFRLRMGEKTIEIVYRKVTDGCYMFNAANYKRLILEGMDHMEVFKNDLSVFLRHSKSVVPEIRIEGKTSDIEQVLNVLKAHAENSKTRNLQLKTTKLSLNGLSAPQILLALSSVDAKSLCSLSICSSKQNVLLDEITETEQWRRLYSFFISGFPLSVRQISHLRTFKGFVTVVTVADLDFLKTAFLKSLNFCSCFVRYTRVAKLSEIAGTFGVQPFTMPVRPRGFFNQWFFRNDKTRVLRMGVNSLKFVHFEHILTVNVPTGAVIIG